MSEWTAAELPSFADAHHDRHGANSGLGEAGPERSGPASGQGHLAVRTPPRRDEAGAAGMTVGDVPRVAQDDLQGPASVRAFADGVDGVDVLVTTPASWPAVRADRDGFESQIGTNHLGTSADEPFAAEGSPSGLSRLCRVMQPFGTSASRTSTGSPPVLGWVAYDRLQAGQPAVTPRNCSAASTRRVEGKAQRRPPGLLRDNLAATRQQSRRTPLMSMATRWPRCRPSAHARRSYAASQTLPGNELHRAQPSRCEGRQADPFRSPLAPTRRAPPRSGRFRAANGHQISL